MSKHKITPEQQAFLGELANCWPLAKGSLTLVRKPCIRPNCPACRDGRKHPAWMFSYTLDGKRRCRYVPAQWVEMLQQAIDNGKRLERRLAQLGSELLERYRQQRH
jgi:hypothetical protein